MKRPAAKDLAIGMLVVVVWHDIEGDSNWKSSDSLDQYVSKGLIDRRTVSWIAGWDDALLILAASVSDDPDSKAGDTNKIPWGVIKAMALIDPVVIKQYGRS